MDLMIGVTVGVILSIVIFKITEALSKRGEK